ncbi:CynX/NimT family MFS transporter [Aneurinibacillus aneurinilyticus]|jgi:CP family cyanate transporter-like MFS transporter|uniref:CynX/NimT family MFS transporter n=1 Tax=Aneurinibacillus aneurinilyticus TaxID=1391 RepID=UPI0023F19AAF|nr:MFS transporter [Aneurinibacillus aneurinilyticus]MCI1692860.1 MFS transporter [Aneurinibacillus aneurinilyticus]
MISETNIVHTRDYSRAGLWLLILGIVLVASNLRAPLTSVGPLIGVIRDDTGISNALAGMLTTFPLLAFALLSPFAPKIARKFGMEMTLLVSLLVLTAGILLRSVPVVGALFWGTALLGMAIAMGNVLLPSMIKQEFPKKMGLMTGVYSVSMNLWAAIASGISIPLAQGIGFGWRGSLLFWALLSAVSLLVWLPQLRYRHQRSAAAQGTVAPAANLWRSRIAWQVTMFMGLQSLCFYVIIAWLPEILRQQGVGSSSAGWMLSLMQFVSLPATFIMPMLASRSSNQRMLVGITSALLLTGYIGLLGGSILFMPLWIILIGIATGSCFSLAVMFFALRTRSVHEAAELSGMAQSIGYLLAAVGPTLFGFIHDATHGWNVSLIMLSIVAVLLFIFGFGAGSSRYVLSEEKNIR